jgi:hypothetical protein
LPAAAGAVAGIVGSSGGAELVGGLFVDWSEVLVVCDLADVAGAGVVDDGLELVVAGSVELNDGIGGGGGPGRPGGWPELPIGPPVLDSVGVGVADDDVSVGVGGTVKLGGCGGRLRLGGGGKEPGIGGVLGNDVVEDGAVVGTELVVDGAVVVGHPCLIRPGCGGQWWCSAATAWLREEPRGVSPSQCLPFSLAPAP